MGGGGCCIGDCCLIDCCAFDAIKSLFRKSSGGGCGYCPGPWGSEDHSKKIAGELEDMKKNRRESTEKVEKSITDELMKSTENFVNELERINHNSFGNVTLKLNIEEIRHQSEMLKNSIKGTFADHLDQRLILTDNELSVILEERDDKKRAKRFNEFCDRIELEAINKLKAKIKKTVENQQKLISGEIKARINEVEKSASDLIDNLTAITKLKNSGDNKAEEQKLNAEYKSELCSIVYDVLE